MREYITVQGDTWDIIALKVYGSEMYMTKLIEANPEHRETVFFSANVKLKVPEIETPIPTTLPPWKRGEE
ncbi:tail protein X [Carboxydothermus pertinax]|uniref:Phage tail protein n=1 Tax=Carboxydothermus pertinax TaxID=870242 RepID=A0A1L8CRY0_9THEO|nr:tail protein X [Carboxydothermus pertinax]GAV21614.1 phage tail protein [Carboxydothermus pertinax]